MSEPAPDPTPYEAPKPPPPRTPRRILALGGLGLVLLGAGKLTVDALALTRTEGAWLPILAGAVALIVAAVWTALDAPTPGGLVEGAPSRRGLLVTLIVTLVAAQALIPLRYYLGDDPFDERFSWRMFSAVRVYQCQMQAFDEVGGRSAEVALNREIHVGWITTMRRNREAVIERYLRWRCEAREVDAARFVNRCRSPEGQASEVIRRVDCATGELESNAGRPL